MDAAQSAFDEASDRQKQVQDGIRDIENKMKADLGKDEAFAKLFDQCFDFKDIEYVELFFIYVYPWSTRHAIFFNGLCINIKIC